MKSIVIHGVPSRHERAEEIYNSVSNIYNVPICHMSETLFLASIIGKRSRDCFSINLEDFRG